MLYLTVDDESEGFCAAKRKNCLEFCFCLTLMVNDRSSQGLREKQPSLHGAEKRLLMGSSFNAILHAHLLKIRALKTMSMLIKELEIKFKHPPGAVLVHSPLLHKV